MDRQHTDACAGILPGEPRVLLLVNSDNEEWNARLLIRSLRSFGGPLSACAVWVFVPPTASVSSVITDIEGTVIIPLEIDDDFRQYPFAAKVLACSRAEEMAAGENRSVVWLSPCCLIIQPPVLLNLTRPLRAAFRPVHIKNVGSPIESPLDGFWKEIYQAVGLSEAAFTVESLVDSVTIRPYFNTHLFSVDPSLRLLRTWHDCFRALITDTAFQSGPCREERHRLFLHQAILSALVARTLQPEQIGVLPREYSYPLHFHHRMPDATRAAALNGLVCPVYEGRYNHPATLNGLEVHEPLRSWLELCAATGKST